MSVRGPVHLYVCVLQRLWLLRPWEFSVTYEASPLKLITSICHSEALSNKG